MDTIEAKDAVPGQWYTKYDRLIIAIRNFPDFGDSVFANGDGEIVILARDEKITPVPECTGWDWVPPKTAEDYLREHNASGLTVDTTPNPGEGWRIADGADWKDERCEVCLSGEWLDRKISAGHPFNPGFRYRIPIDPEPKHPPVPEGWEVRPGVVSMPGDKYWLHNSSSSEWLTHSGYREYRFNSSVTIIRRIEPEYRPFANAAEFDPYADKIVVVIETGTRHRIPSWSDAYVNGMPWDRAHAVYQFLDGSPFGLEVST